MDLNLEVSALAQPEQPDVEEIKQNIEKETQVTVDERLAIINQAQANAEKIMNIDMGSMEARKAATAVIDDFGRSIESKTNRKNEFLQRRLALTDGLGNPTIAKDLSDLDIHMRDLDPSAVNFLQKGAFGKVSKPVRRYFERYKTADQQISSIIKSLLKSKKQLQNDNVTLEAEEVAMIKLTRELAMNIELAEQLDLAISTKLDELRASDEDPDKVSFIEQDILFPLREKITDFQQLMAVNQQGVMAMRLLRSTNAELIRSIDRVRMVSIYALRVGVTCAYAIYNQKIALDKINEINATTTKLIKSNSELLKTQGLEITQKATEANISLDVLKEAFENYFEVSQAIATYKQEALPTMKQQIEEFDEFISEANRKINNSGNY